MSPRRAMTPARKARIHQARDGVCWWCTHPVPVDGPHVIYDHRICLDLSGDDDDANIWPLHAAPCNKAKTREDYRLIAKARRIRVRLAQPLPAGRIPRRQFSKKRLQRQPGRADVRPRLFNQGATQ